MAVNDDELVILSILTLVCSIIAIVLLLLYVIAYFCERSMRTFSNELVLYLCCSELIGSIFNLLNSEDKNSIKCMLHASGKTIFPLMSIFFSSAIQFTIYATTIKLIDFIEKKCLMRSIYIIVSLTIPFIFGIM